MTQRLWNYAEIRKLQVINSIEAALTAGMRNVMADNQNPEQIFHDHKDEILKLSGWKVKAGT